MKARLEYVIPEVEIVDFNLLEGLLGNSSDQLEDLDKRQGHW